MPQWPETLPQSPLADSFREMLANTVVRTAMEQGPAKLRQRTTAGVSEMNLGYILSAGEAVILDTFYNETVFGGALAFDFPHPRTGSTVSCRFKKPPVLQAINGNYFRAAVEMEVLP